MYTRWRMFCTETLWLSCECEVCILDGVASKLQYGPIGRGSATVLTICLLLEHSGVPKYVKSVLAFA